MLFVFFRKQIIAPRPRPLDVQSRIVKFKPSLGGRAIKIVALVAEKRIVLQDHKAMGEAAGNEKLPSVLRALADECDAFNRDEIRQDAINELKKFVKN